MSEYFNYCTYTIEKQVKLDFKVHSKHRLNINNTLIFGHLFNIFAHMLRFVLFSNKLT